MRKYSRSEIQNPQSKILFICLDRTTFVEDDLKLLKERYDVRVFEFGGRGSDTRAGRAVGQLREAGRQVRWLRRELPGAALVFGWFVDYHMALPTWMARRRGVPVVAVLGGFDANHVPELGYGVWDSRWRAPLARYVARNASLLLAVSRSLIHSTMRYGLDEPRENGIRAHVRDLRTPVRVVPTGYVPEDWPMGPARRSPVVSTVALVSDERTLRVKGLDILIEAARRLPEVKVQVVGVGEAFQPAVRRLCRPPANVELVAPRPRETLPEVYAETSVYAQLSRVEGLPNVLCEAMLCGCIPVGSPVGGIPEAIGEAGRLVGQTDPAHVAGVIQETLESATPEKHQAARRRIVEHFSKDRRRQALFDTLDRLQNGEPA